MSDTGYIKIQFGLKSEQRHAAAQGFYQAFQEKCAIFGSRDRVIRALAAGMNVRQAIVAVLNEEVVGIAAFKFRNRPFLDLQSSNCMRELGVFRGLLAVFMHIIFKREPCPRELLMYGLYVSDRYRGRGIGTLLLDAICTLARAKVKQFVRLQVVDTNPNARQLYERLGFVADKTKD